MEAAPGVLWRSLFHESPRHLAKGAIPTQQLTSGCSLPSRNPCDLSVDLDETLFGFGRVRGAGLDVATTG